MNWRRYFNIQWLVWLSCLLLALSACDDSDDDQTQNTGLWNVTPHKTIEIKPIPEPEHGLITKPERLDEEGTFKMTVVESTDPKVKQGTSKSGEAYIEAYGIGHNLFRGQIVFDGLKSLWKYRNVLDFSVTETSIDLEMVAIPIVYVTNVHPCGDSWEEVYTTLTSGGGDWETLLVEMVIKRDVYHRSNVTGCGAPKEASYYHIVQFEIH